MKLIHGFVVSDLHIFTKWTTVEKYMQEINNAACKSDFGVFNGDIFDFKWSTLNSSKKTAEEASKWILKICKSNPRCNFYYIMGNHDAHIVFPEYLNSITKQVKNFKWSASHFFIGTFLFMHGDLLFTLKKSSPFKRPENKFMSKAPKRKYQVNSYNFAINMGAQKFVSSFMNTKQTSKYITKVLKNNYTDQLDNVNDVYIGHTHAAFSNFKYENYIFHNTGSAISGLECNILNIKTKIPKI
jgi:UDP-2,3-diacylglucosamine hydrolase